MITNFDVNKIVSMENLRHDPARSERLERYKQEEHQRCLDESVKILMAGNVQITHVSHEITRKDVDTMQFDTDVFFKYCKWAKLNPALYNKLKEWKVLDRGFYLTGETGKGKTVFCKTLALQMIRDGGVKALNNKDFVKFVNFGKLLTALSKDDWVYSQYIIQEAKKADNLFIDDLGTESYKEFYEKTLFELIDDRMHKENRDGVPLRTFFTSNHPIMSDQLPYAPRIKRRIHEMSVLINV